MRIGIDVGGTNTDAVLMDGSRVVREHKEPTTLDVTTGVTSSLQAALCNSGVPTSQIDGVMIGTTHFTNAFVERDRLMEVAAIRLGLPATECLPPMVDWPADLREAVGNHAYLCHGGNEFNGRSISPIDEREMRWVAQDMEDKGLKSAAISSVFSPVDPDMENHAAAILKAEMPDITISLSHEIGRIGLLERENAAIMNASLRELAQKIIGSFRDALMEMDIDAPFFISQNDGTLMSAELAKRYPVLTFASGPTNSMRGAAFLSGVEDAVVVDLGGTTTDVGMLLHGFPREASGAMEVGGVRTNFRMPDVYSVGLGGGSVVSHNPLKIGPRSVGYELTRQGMVFGGPVLTATDVAVAGGLASIGEKQAVESLDSSLIEDSLTAIQTIVDNAVDRIRTSAKPIPVILVGGGSILVSKPVQGASEIIKPDHFVVANAVGAAIAQVGGEIDRVFSMENMSRNEALDQAKQEARDKAIEAGAKPETVEIVDIEEVPLTYLPSNATRVRVKAVGDLALSYTSAS